MCGRYTLTRHENVVEDLQASLGTSTQSEWWKARFNVAPTQPAPVVIREGDHRVIELLRWGLVPFWAARDPKGAPLMINARVETLNNKQWFREALATRRCLVPADGFFEWQREDPRKPRPIYFHPRDRHTIAFAGLWAKAKTKAGEQLSFAIITGPANELVRPVHDRMPIVLAPGDYDAWLDPAVDGEHARAMLGAATVDDWVGEAVSPRVNKWEHDDAGCIAPLDEPAQGTLF